MELGQCCLDTRFPLGYPLPWAGPRKEEIQKAEHVIWGEAWGMKSIRFNAFWDFPSQKATVCVCRFEPLIDFEEGNTKESMKTRPELNSF